MEQQKFCIMVHYRNPFFYNAGSENYIISQIEYLKSCKINTLLIFPVRKNFTFTIKGWGVVSDSSFYGIKSASSVKKMINKLNKRENCVGIFIHSLIGSEISEVKAMVMFGAPVVLYLHDYSTCCVQYNLLRNDEVYCGDACLEKSKCSKCKYFNFSLKLKSNILKLVSNIENIVIVAPSAICAELWIDAYPEFREKVSVIPHQKPINSYLGNNKLLNKVDSIKIAFVGNGIKIKGWNVWKEAIEKVNKEKLQLYHFGKVSTSLDGVTNISVSIQKDGRDAMIKALRKYEIDVAILFSEWPETYSYTYYECLASNCYVITCDLSGNIAYEVKKNNNGSVIEYTVDSLANIIQDEFKLKKLINEYRGRKHYSPQSFKMNYDYINFLDFKRRDYKNIQIGTDEFVSASICNLLYRIRYKNDLKMLKSQKANKRVEK